MYYITEIFCSLQVNLGCFRLYLTLCGSFQVVSCSLQVVSSFFFLVVGRFRSFLAHCRLFQVVSCSLQVISCCFSSFLARCRSFHVISGRFLLVVGRFRSFLACCKLFQVVPHFSKYRLMLHLVAWPNFLSLVQSNCYPKEERKRGKERE